MGKKANCPYCGSGEFLPQNDAASEPIEVVCAACGGHASRKILQEGLTEGGGIMHSEKDMIPLSEAASLAVRRISLLSESKIGTESQRLDTAAIALSVDVPIYTIDDRGTLRRIDQEALLAGRIRDGGRRLVFGDKRAPITWLVVEKDEALKALDGLAALNIARAVNASDSRSRDGEDGR